MVVIALGLAFIAVIIYRVLFARERSRAEEGEALVVEYDAMRARGDALEARFERWTEMTTAERSQYASDYTAYLLEADALRVRRDAWLRSLT